MPHHAGGHAVHSHDGCNMNDSSYPFRGDYRVDQVVNHGHGGTWKAAPTGLSLKITGTNLKLESISASKANVLSCELGVGTLKPRPVVFAAGGPSMDVPGDQKEYHVNAIVSGSRSKHYCHLTLLSYGDNSIPYNQMQEDGSVHRALTMTVHPQLPPVLLEVNGNPIAPRGGVFHIPSRASTLQLIPGAAMAAPSTLPGNVHLHVVQGTDSSAAITLPSGEDVLLNPDRNPYVELPLTNSTGMLRLRLPRVVNSLDFTGAPSHTDPLDVDIRAASDLRGGTNVTVTATGANIEAMIDGRATQGFSSLSFVLHDPNRKFGTVILTLRDPATHRLLLRQTLQIPLGNGDTGNPTSHPSLRVEESSGSTRLLFTPYEGYVSVDGGAQSPGHQGVSVDCSQPRTITVTQRSPDGTSSTAQVSLTAKANENQKWLEDLATVLEDQSKPLDQLQAALSAIRPPTQAAQRVLHGVARMLARPVPNIEFKIQGTNLITDVACAAHNLAVAHGNAAACITPPGGSVQLHGTQPTRVMALDPRGQVSAAVTLRLANVTAAPEEQLVKDMLDTTRSSAASQHSPVDFANRLLSISTTSVNGQLLLPEMAALIKRYSDGRLAVQAQDSILQCNVEQNSGLVGAVQFDGQPSRPLTFNTAIPFPGSTKYVTLKVTRSGSVFDQELLDAYKRSDPALLSRRWGEQVRPVDAKEQELLTALIALAKDIEALKSNERKAGGHGAAAPAAPISFVCGDGMLTNIRSDGMQLSAYVDDMSSIGVGQGGQVPQGVPFTDGSHHRVRLVARDSVGTVRGEVFAVISGAKSFGGSGGSGISYLDAAVLPEKGNVRVTLTSPSGYRIHCDVDNTRGEASTANEASFVVDGTKAHVIGVNVSDGQGAVVFQQRLQVPMMVAPSWSLALQGNVLTLIPSPSDRGFSVTAAVDQQHERVVDSPQIRLDHDVGHQVILRKYFGDNSSPVGELLLRLPHFVDPDDVIAATKGLQNSAPLEVKAVADRTNSGILRRLLGELLGKFNPGGGVMEDFYRKSTTIGSGGPSAGPTVFFRLRGDEEKSHHHHLRR